MSEIGALAKALVKAQAEMKHPKLDSSNPHYKSKFASLLAVRNAAIPVLNKHGIAVLQPGVERDGGIGVRTILVHESGEMLDCGVVSIPVSGNAHAYISAMTYCERRGLSSALSLTADNDDDGNVAVEQSNPAPQKDKPKITKAEIDFRKSCGEAKELIGEAGYYEVLGQCGFAKASEVGNKEDRANVLSALRAYYVMNKEG